MPPDKTVTCQAARIGYQLLQLPSIGRSLVLVSECTVALQLFYIAMSEDFRIGLKRLIRRMFCLTELAAPSTAAGSSMPVQSVKLSRTVKTDADPNTDE